MNTAHEETYRGCKIRLEYDEDPMNPRKEFDNVGHMVCWHHRYNLGDKKPNGDPSEYLLSIAQEAVSPNYPELLLRANCAKILAKHYVILDLFLYDHSGITMSTGAFSCPWDSGRVGFIYCDLKKAKENWLLKGDEDWDHIVYPADNCPDYVKGSNLVGKTLRECAAILLEGEVETYDAYLTGQIVGFIAEDPDGEEIHSCWGFWPDEKGDWPDAIAEAQSAIDHWCDMQDKESTEAAHWAARDVQTISQPT